MAESELLLLARARTSKHPESRPLHHVVLASSHRPLEVDVDLVRPVGRPPATNSRSIQKFR